MKFIPASFAPLLLGLFIMTTMIMGMPFIMLIQNMPYDNPIFWTKWGDIVITIAPYAVPLALCASILGKFIIGQLTIQPEE